MQVPISYILSVLNPYVSFSNPQIKPVFKLSPLHFITLRPSESDIHKTVLA